jgi:hypothetical protein
MDLESQSQPRYLPEAFQPDFANFPVRKNVRIHEPYAARSARNIAAWESYLPPDCVAAMIKMGWDRTT